MYKLMGKFDKDIITSDEWPELKTEGKARYFLDSDEYDIHDFIFHDLETNKYYETQDCLLEVDGTCGDITLGKEIFPSIEYSLIYGANLNPDKSYQIKIECDNNVGNILNLIRMLTDNLNNLLNKDIK